MESKWMTSSLVRLAQEIAPRMHVVSVSEPAPAVRNHNVVAVVGSTEEARRAVLALEAVEPVTADDAGIGLIGMGTGPGETQGVDPEGLVVSTWPRVVLGGIVGALVGGALGGALGAVLQSGIAVIGPAIAAAALLAVFGATWAAFAGFGGSDAYRQTYVPPHGADISVVSFHTDDRALADAAFDRLAGRHPEVVMLDATLGRTERTVDDRAVGR